MESAWNAKPAEMGALHDEKFEDVGYRRPVLNREGCGGDGGCGCGGGGSGIVGDGDCDGGGCNSSSGATSPAAKGHVFT